MAGSTVKKVVVRRFDRESLPGFVNPQSYLRPEGVELLRPDGTVSVIPYQDVKSVAFVRDFEDGEQEPERKIFTARPKMGGLWVRMRLRDGDQMDGVLSNNLLQLDFYGFTVTPPDPDSGSQRVFVPRAALRDLQVLGVVGSPLRRAKPKGSKDQIRLFE
ncbi:MAG: hypothetical protein FJW37_10250 [Acidobacteria bacterium]|nr:hypothetical protein [Acidobacteriota bacterium]